MGHSTIRDLLVFEYASQAERQDENCGSDVLVFFCNSLVFGHHSKSEVNKLARSLFCINFGPETGFLSDDKTHTDPESSGCRLD